MASFLTHTGRYLLTLKAMFRKPENWKMYWREFMHQCSEIGIGSLPIVVIISVFLGAVTTVQTAYQLGFSSDSQSYHWHDYRDTIMLELSPQWYVLCWPAW